jgi:molybdate transport system substrate-binding protein
MNRAAWLFLFGLGCSCEPAASGSLTVLAASSLTEAFSELEAVFEAEHAGVDVVVSTAGSQKLVMQVRHGLAADVMASADERQLDALEESGDVAASGVFAGNTLVLGVGPGAPLDGLEALPTVGRLVVGADEVPIGRYTHALFRAAEGRFGPGWRTAVEARVVSREPNVRLVAAKVAMGEADAAIVYGSDVLAVSGIRAVAIPAGLAPEVVYRHARLVDAPSPPLADAWMRLVESPRGQAVLASHGFTEAP